MDFIFFPPFYDYIRENMKMFLTKLFKIVVIYLRHASTLFSRSFIVTIVKIDI